MEVNLQNVTSFLTYLGPFMYGLFVDLAVPVVITLASAWVSMMFTRFTGKNLEARDRDALHSALTTGVNMSIVNWLSANPTKKATDITKDPVAVNSVARQAEEYVRHSVPDAIKSLNPAGGILLDLILSKLPYITD